MKGSTFKRTLPSGTIVWCLNVDIGKDENGKRQRIFKGGFLRKVDADAELTKILQEQHDGLLVKPTPKTFGDFLAEWLDQAPGHCGLKTVERYCELSAYILPTLGSLQLRDVSTRILDLLYKRLCESGGKEGRPLSAKTVRNTAGVVHAALGTAVRWKLLRINPADACQLPKLERKEAKALDFGQTQRYVDAARDHWLYPILAVGSATGCRRGEMLALAWPDADLETGILLVSKSLEQTKKGLRIKPPKNGEPRRVPLPELAIEVLREHRRRQEEWRQKFGPDYRTDLDLIFCEPDGNYRKPDSVTAAACLLARKTGLGEVGLHTLRHSHGSQLLKDGVPLPTVSKRLGHSSVYVTAQVYSHAFAQDEIDAAKIWNVSMKKAMQGEKAKTEKQDPDKDTLHVVIRRPARHRHGTRQILPPR